MREMKLLPSAKGGNLFLEEIPPYSTMARPEWIERVLEANPHEKFWQFHFDPPETKNGREVHSLVPKQLLNPLEDYCAHYRPVLVHGNDPGVPTQFGV